MGDTRVLFKCATVVKLCTGHPVHVDTRPLSVSAHVRRRLGKLRHLASVRLTCMHYYLFPFAFKQRVASPCLTPIVLTSPIPAPPTSLFQTIVISAKSLMLHPNPHDKMLYVLIKLSIVYTKCLVISVSLCINY